MDSSRYVGTVGMNQVEAHQRLLTSPSGVLALADVDRAYAVPVAHTVHDERIFLRLTDDGNSEKVGYLEATTGAALVCYGEEWTTSGASCSGGR
jgi:nitroimidazol reductase NimA-like FMN-containing flavoprotein (pyridoxamine 5'-phosphate oxidase superfamily)